MSMRRPQAARKTARPPVSPTEARSHYSRKDDDSDEDMLHSVRPRKAAGVPRNTAHKSAPAKPSSSRYPPVVTSSRPPGIGKAARKNPTPEYRAEDDSAPEVSDTPSESDETSGSMSMSEPSSQDEDTLVMRLAHIDIRRGSSAPGPAPNADELLDELIDEALDLKLSVDPKPPLYGAYAVNYFLSEYDAATDGPVDSSEQPRLVRVDGGWRCPFFVAHEKAYKGCVLYGVRFPNVAILGLHLSRHHSDVEVHWRDIQAGKVPQLYIYPRSTEPEIECITTYYDPTAMGNPKLRVIPKIEPEPDIELSPTPDTMDTDSLPPMSVTPPPVPAPVPPTPIKREPSPAPSADSDIVELIALPEPPPARPQILRERRTGIPLDPYIRPPYLTSPVPTEDGKFIYYSCRPGGPRIYDYLQTLSLKPYGLMRWQVEETEAHILEAEGLSDVGKCMHALHNRWFFLHEVEMYVNPAKCIAEFVHTWWRHIYNMVGIKALKFYLLEFGHLKYLTPRQSGDICQQYRADVKAGTAEDGSLLPLDQ
ncbi:hypothetical protein PENSPDRAFT_646017 [Peniophora sp. CONT]|nr:hypothetical protein PENSPDRAFT_646017 [Peniophora sp. CONT]